MNFTGFQIRIAADGSRRAIHSRYVFEMRFQHIKGAYFARTHLAGNF